MANTETESNTLTEAPPKISEWRHFYRVFFSRGLVIFGMIVIGLFLLTAIFADFLAPYDPYELGAGKTCLVRGLAEGLGIAPEKVHSPSFMLVLLYEDGRLPLYHIDLFRLHPGAADRLALREYVYGDGVCAIEWFEHLGEPLDDFLEISLTFVEAEERRLVAVGHGVGYDPVLDLLRKW